MAHIIQEVFDQLETIAKVKHASVTLKSGHPGPIWVKADPQRIMQVMSNLVENAVKYGNENGRVMVNLDEDKKHILVSVRDNGPGIPLEHLSRIFERFYRVEKSRSKDRGGTGLGLAIVKHILNAHKTKITVKSQLEKGTTFRFKLERME